jgi:Fic family protein
LFKLYDFSTLVKFKVLSFTFVLDLYLNAVRCEENWEQWISFFLEGIYETAKDAKNILKAIQQLFDADLKKITTLKRPKNSALLVFDCFRQKPLLTVAELVKLTKLSKPTIAKTLEHLIKFDIVKPATDKTWGQIYSYQKYIDKLNSTED